MKKILLISGSVLLAVLGLGWLGLQVQPAPFAGIPQPAQTPASMPLPEGLPAPVERFYRQLYGERIPLIHSLVISGRASMRPVFGGPTLPSRFRFVHLAGQGYRHYIEATLFGIPILRINEWYVDGQGRFVLPVIGVAEGPTINQGANLGMWSELAFWAPAVLLSDPRVSWEPVDESTALLVVPFEQGQERFLVRFDPQTGMLQMLESMRYKGTSASKVLWLNQALSYGTPGLYRAGTVGAATWLDEGSPWAVFQVDQVSYNVDVDITMSATGP